MSRFTFFIVIILIGAAIYFVSAYKNDAVSRGISHLQQGDCKSATKQFNDALDVAPGNFKANYYRGFCYLEAGQNAKAVADYNAAIKENPNDEYAYFYRGIAYYNSKNYKYALADFKSYKQKATENAEDVKQKYIAEFQRLAVSNDQDVRIQIIALLSS